MTEENHEKVLARACKKSVRQIDVLVSELAPRPDVESRVRAVPQAVRQSPAKLDLFKPAPTVARPATPCSSSQCSYSQRSSSKVSANHSSKLQPLSPRKYQLTITLDQESFDDLGTLQALPALAHKFPDADPLKIVAFALSELKTETLKKKAAIINKPRPRKNTAKTNRVRSIPAALQREVWKRDEGKCRFRGADGHVCLDKRMVEFHHKMAFAKGGQHTLDNIELRAREGCEA